MHSLIIAFFNYLHLCYLYSNTATDVSILPSVLMSNKNPAEHNFYTNLKNH
jgi:hypothetical protein